MVFLRDASGSERFSHVRDNFFLGSHGAIFCFDVTQRSSFEHLGKWIKEVDEKANNDNLQKAIVACKADSKQRAVSKEEAHTFAIMRSAKYFETSSLLSSGIEAVFDNLAAAEVDRQDKEAKEVASSKRRSNVRISEPTSNNRGSFRGFKMRRPRGTSTRSLGKSFRFKRPTSDDEAVEVGMAEVQLNEELKDENLQLPKKNKKRKSLSVKRRRRKKVDNEKDETDNNNVDETVINCNQLVFRTPKIKAPSCCAIS